MKTLVVILGPTGVGKTEKTLAIARQLCVPVINADSRQIFKEIPIGSLCAHFGTAELSQAFLRGHPLHPRLLFRKDSMRLMS